MSHWQLYLAGFLISPEWLDRLTIQLYTFLIFNARIRTAKWMNYATKAVSYYRRGDISKSQPPPQNPWTGVIHHSTLRGQGNITFFLIELW